MESKRIEYLDAVKGFAMLLVVMAHTIGWNFLKWEDVVLFNIENPINVMNAGFIWQLIYSFHMALFFMISGYFLTVDYKCINIIIKKSKRLLLPYFVTGFLLLIVRDYYGYWFLFSLWELSVIGAILNVISKTVNKKSNLVYDIFIFISAYIVLRYLLKLPYFDNPICDIEKCTSYLLPFFLGMIMRKYEQIRTILLNHLGIYIICFVFLFTWRYMPLLGVDKDGLIYRGGNYLANLFFLPIIGSIMIITIFKNGILKRFQSFFSNIGKSSLEIYIFHLFFVFQIPQVGDFWLSTNLPTVITSQLCYSLIVSLIAIAFSLMISFALKKSKVLSKLFFGI